MNKNDVRNSVRYKLVLYSPWILVCTCICIVVLLALSAIQEYVQTTTQQKTQYTEKWSRLVQTGRCTEHSLVINPHQTNDVKAVYMCSGRLYLGPYLKHSELELFKQLENEKLP